MWLLINERSPDDEGYHDAARHDAVQDLIGSFVVPRRATDAQITDTCCQHLPGASPVRQDRKKTNKPIKACKEIAEDAHTIHLHLVDVTGAGCSAATFGVFPAKLGVNQNNNK